MKRGIRITGGQYRGRYLDVPRGALVRPTQERVREALFSALGQDWSGRTVLDLFAGSGAMGLEAWSRGADRVCWVEQDARAFACLQANLRQLGVPTNEGQAVRSSVERFLRRPSPAFDFVLADPPYDAHTSEHSLILLLQAIAAAGCVADGGWFILEQRATTPVQCVDPWGVAKEKVYGETRLIFYRATGPITKSEP